MAEATGPGTRPTGHASVESTVRAHRIRGPGALSTDPKRRNRVPGRSPGTRSRIRFVQRSGSSGNADGPISVAVHAGRASAVLRSADAVRKRVRFWALGGQLPRFRKPSRSAGSRGPPTSGCRPPARPSPASPPAPSPTARRGGPRSAAGRAPRAWRPRPRVRAGYG